jgi:tRNA A37 threonylcarbamoyltransferase TsaD
MNLLGIETSCDETAAAVIAETGETAAPWRIRSNVVASQAAIHREWGGVVPELASRQHVRDICGVYEAALSGASLTIDDIGAVAVTQGPGPWAPLSASLRKALAHRAGFRLFGSSPRGPHRVAHARPRQLPLLGRARRPGGHQPASLNGPASTLDRKNETMRRGGV